MNTELFLLASTLAWPLLLVLGLAIPALRQGALHLVPSAAVPAFFTALLPSPDLELSLPWLLLGTNLGVDDVSSLFLLFSSLLWTIGAVSLPQTGRASFAGWFLLAMTGNFAVLLAQDVPSFYLSYALMSLSAFGLVLHERTFAARRAARVYLVFAVLGEVVLLVALIMVAHNAETLDIEHVVDRTPQHLLMALLLVAFGIKAGVPLLHLSLPPAYAAAPLAAAVPMAGAMLHLGLYGWMRFLPFGQSAVTLWSGIFVTVGAVAVIYGTLVGLTQRQCRPLLAYSSISQMGLMTLGVGIGLGSPDNWPTVQAVLLLYALHHALAKGALFHGLGIRGKARIGLWLPALALAGLPFTGGALAKGLLKTQVHFLPEISSVLATWVIPLGSVGTTLLMARFLYLARREEPLRDGITVESWWPLLLALLLLPWIVPLPLERVSPLWSALWPLFLAGVPAWFAFRGGFARFLTGIPTIPPGDILVLAEKLWARIPMPHAHHPAHKQENEAILKPGTVPTPIAASERVLGRWQVAVVLLLILVTGILWLLARSPATV